MKNLPTPRLLELIALLLLLSTGRASAQAPTWQWATSHGAGGGYSTATDAAGNTYVTGFFSDTAVFGVTTLTCAGMEDGFVAKLNRSGTYEWVAQIGGPGLDTGGELALDNAGNVYVTGTYSDSVAFGPTLLTTPGQTHNGFVAKLSPTGAWLWATAAGTIGSLDGIGLTLDATGNVYITGAFTGSTAIFGATTVVNSDTAHYSRDVFAAKLSPTGAWQWAVSAGGNRGDNAVDIGVDATGNTYLSGNFRGPSATFGSTIITTSGRSAGFVAKISPMGTWLWAVATESDNCFGLVLDAGGDAYVTGTIRDSTARFGPTTLTNRGGTNVFVAKLSPVGAWRWAVGAGGIGWVTSQRMTLSATGDLWLTGSYRGRADFGSAQFNSVGSSDLFVAKLTTAGVWQWAASAGSIGCNTVGWGCSVDPNGDVLVSGLFNGAPVDFGGTTLPLATGFSTGFTARLSPPPTGLPPEPGAPAFTLSPNPTHSAATLTGLAPGAAVTLHDAVGREVRAGRADPAGTASLDVRGLPASFYVVRAGSATRRLVVE